MSLAIAVARRPASGHKRTLTLFGFRVLVTAAGTMAALRRRRASHDRPAQGKGRAADAIEQLAVWF